MKLAILISLAARLVAPHAMACQMVDGERILAGDFAAVNPAFATIDPKFPLASTPWPGVTRIFRADEIARLARANGLTLDAPVSEMCFERATQPLTAEMLMPALRAGLAGSFGTASALGTAGSLGTTGSPGTTGTEDARIEILDFSRAGVPRGTLEFSRAGLSANGLWRGHLSYGEARSVPVWAQVRVSVERTWVEALGAIASGKLIDPSQLVLRRGPQFPFGAMPVDSIELTAGRKALRAIRAGEPIFAFMLILPHEVERGDTVRVEVASGGARLEFDAVAQSSAHIGESVMVRNPENNRYFKAQVEDKGKVSVTK